MQKQISLQEIFRAKKNLENCMMSHFKAKVPKTVGKML